MGKNLITPPKVEPKGIFATRRICFEKHITDTKLAAPIMDSLGLMTAQKADQCPICTGVTVGVALFRDMGPPDEVLISNVALQQALTAAKRLGKPDGEMVQEFHTILEQPFAHPAPRGPWRY